MAHRDSLARLCGSSSVYNLGSLHIATKLEHEVNRITRGCQYTAERQRQTIECCLAVLPLAFYHEESTEHASCIRFASLAAQHSFDRYRHT